MALRILDLYPAKWLERPEGYDLVGVKGVLDEDGQSLKGALDGAGCGAIMLRRAGAVQPSAQETVPSAQVQFNDDLLKLNREVFQLYQAGAYDQALAKANEAVALAERLYGTTDHPTAAAELRFSCNCCATAGRSAEAEPLIRRALAIDEKALGPNDPAVALDIQILAGVLIDKALKAPRRSREATASCDRTTPGDIGEGRTARAVCVPAPALDLSPRGEALDGTPVRCGVAPKPPSEDREPAAPSARSPVAIRHDSDAPQHDRAGSTLEVRGRAGPWRNALSTHCRHRLCGHADRRLSLSLGVWNCFPVRFVFFALAYAWPIVLTVGLVAPVSWRGSIRATAIYVSLFAVDLPVGVARSDSFTWDRPQDFGC